MNAGIGYDSHTFQPGRPLMLGGVEIPEAELGLGGHSDGDALTHALIDALLGAAVLGPRGPSRPQACCAGGDGRGVGAAAARDTGGAASLSLRSAPGKGRTSPARRAAYLSPSTHPLLTSHLICSRRSGL